MNKQNTFNRYHKIVLSETKTYGGVDWNNTEEFDISLFFVNVSQIYDLYFNTFLNEWEFKIELNDEVDEMYTINETEKAILECKTCRDKINRYIKRLSNKKMKSREKAKELVRSKQKDRAKVYLKMAKLHEEQIKVSEGQLEKVQSQISQIESTQNLQECMNCLKKGNEVLKNMQNTIKIEEWEKVKDDMDELKEKDKEISNYFKEYGIDEEQCDEEVNNELDKLLNEIQGGNKVDLPSVPKDEISEDKDKVEQINVKKKVIAS